MAVQDTVWSFLVFLHSMAPFLSIDSAKFLLPQ